MDPSKSNVSSSGTTSTPYKMPLWLPLRPPVDGVPWLVARARSSASRRSTGGAAFEGGGGGATDPGRTQTTTTALVNSAGQGHGVRPVRRTTLPLRPPLSVIVGKEVKESSSQPGAGAGVGIGVDVTGGKNPDSAPVRMAKLVYKGKTRNLGIPVEDYKKLLIKAGLLKPEPEPKPTLVVEAAPVVQVKAETAIPAPAASSVNPKPAPALVNPKPAVSVPAIPNRNSASPEIGRSPLDNNNHNRNDFGIGPSPSASVGRVGTRVSDSDSDARSCISLAVGRKTVKLAIPPAKYLKFLKQAKLI